MEARLRRAEAALAEARRLTAEARPRRPATGAAGGAAPALGGSSSGGRDAPPAPPPVVLLRGTPTRGRTAWEEGRPDPGPGPSRSPGTSARAGGTASAPASAPAPAPPARSALLLRTGNHGRRPPAAARPLRLAALSTQPRHRASATASTSTASTAPPPSRDASKQEQLRAIARGVADRIRSLHRQQLVALRQLQGLRVEQLKLRQQQLSALLCLLNAETACLAAAPTQLAVVTRAANLLSFSLSQIAESMLRLGEQGDRHPTAEEIAAASVADSNAEEVSQMARNLLEALRRHPWSVGHRARRGAEGCRPAGLSAAQVAALPLEPWAGPAEGATCAVCLEKLGPGDPVRRLGCPHRFHAGCLDEWLLRRNCCPLCKAPAAAA